MREGGFSTLQALYNVMEKPIEYSQVSHWINHMTVCSPSFHKQQKVIGLVEQAVKTLNI